MFNKLKSLQLNNEFMKYFHNTSWLFIDRVIKMIIGFFIIIWLTRYLGPEGFGLLSYSQSFVSIFLSFATLGLDIVVIRELVKDQSQRDILLGTAFYLKLLTSVLMIVLILVINNFIIEYDESRVLINIISFSILFQSLSVVDVYFQSKVLSKYVVYVSGIGFMISSVLKMILILNDAELIYFAYAFLIDSIILGIGFVYIYRLQKLSLMNWKFDKNVAIGFFKSAWPLVLIAVSAFIYTRVDQIMIKNMISAEAVGNYAAAIKVSELFYFIPSIIVASLFPKIVEAKQNSEEGYINLLEKLYKLVLWMAIPIAICISYFSDTIANILYGSQYNEVGSILSILAFGIIFASITTVFVKILYIEHFERKYLYRSLFGVVINIILNYILIKIYGVIGAAIATIITLFLVNYVFDLFDKSLRKFYYMKFKCFIPYVWNVSTVIKKEK